MPVNPNDITAYRKKKKRRNFIYKFLAAGLFLTGALIIILNAGEIFEPLRGIASKIDNTTSDTEGFPVELPGSADYHLGGFGNGFYLLTDTYLYTYSTSGKQKYALQHGYSRPVCKASERRILLYDHNSQDFSLYSKTSLIYQIKLDEKIVGAEVSSDDSVAIISTSPLYSNILRIYDGSGKLRFTRRFVDEEVNDVYFSGKSSEIIVITSGIKNGDIISYVYRIKTNIEDGIVWKRELETNSWALDVIVKETVILVLCDNMLCAIDIESGEITGKYSFNTGSLQKPSYGQNINLLLLYDDISGSNLFVLLDNSLTPIAIKNMTQNLTQVEIYNEIVYTLEGSVFRSYNTALEETASYELDDEYADFIKLNSGNIILVLGYDNVSSVELK